MGEDIRQKILDANRRFHEELARRGLYAKQPFLNPLNRERVRGIIDNLAQRAGNDFLLDVGCGTGFILGIASGGFKRLAGVDITPEMLKQIPPIPNLELHVAQAENLPFADNTFNVISLHGVLHHFYELAPPFREIFRCLKPGGIFYADESPNAYCLRALCAVETSDPSLSVYLREAARSVQEDIAVYEREYSMDPEIIRMAMYRDKILGGIEQEEVLAVLEEAGFSGVEYQYRWFIGQGKFFGLGYDEESRRVEEYLRGLLPMTRPLFKYISFLAVKG